MPRKKKDCDVVEMELDNVRVHGRIEAVRINEREIELKFRIVGSVEMEDGSEYSYDEQVSVTAGKCMIPKDGD